MSEQREKNGPDQSRWAPERITMVVSITIVLTLVGLISYDYLAHGQQPPHIVVTLQRDQTRPLDSGYALPVVITNKGELTATNIHIVVSLTAADRQPERAEIQMSFLAGGTSERRMLIVNADPARTDTRVDSITFGVP